MKTVYIPDADHPFVCEINNVKYEYPQGTMQTVPDEVAELIENNNEQIPKPSDYREAPAGSVWTYGEDGKGHWGAAPSPSGGGGGIECYVDYEATPVTDDGDDYYPVKIKSNDEPLSAEFVFNNHDKNIYVVIIHEYSQEVPDQGTATISEHYTVPILGVGKGVLGGVTMYNSFKADNADTTLSLIMEESLFGNYNIYCGVLK